MNRLGCSAQRLSTDSLLRRKLEHTFSDTFVFGLERKKSDELYLMHDNCIAME